MCIFKKELTIQLIVFFVNCSASDEDSDGHNFKIAPAALRQAQGIFGLAMTLFFFRSECWKQNYFFNTVGVGEKRDEAVDAKAEAGGGGHAVFQSG